MGRLYPGIGPLSTANGWGNHEVGEDSFYSDTMFLVQPIPNPSLPITDYRSLITNPGSGAGSGSGSGFLLRSSSFLLRPRAMADKSADKQARARIRNRFYR